MNESIPSHHHGGKNSIATARFKRQPFWKLLLATLMVIAGVQLLSGVAYAVSDEVYARNLEIFKRSPVVDNFFNNAYGYAYFPVVGKGGVGIGVAFGTGRVYRQGELTGRTSLIELSIGMQLGGQAYSEIIFFEDKLAYDEFTRGNFELDATASAVAIIVGAHAEAGTIGTNVGVTVAPDTGTLAPAPYINGMAVFTHTKGGLMLEASIGGQKFFYDELRR